MLAARPFTPTRTGLGTRKAMLATLVRELNMVRLSVGAVAMIALVGCTGLIEDGTAGLTKEEAAARDAWIKGAAPVLTTNCIACHNGSRPMVEFLAGDGDLAIRDSILAFTPAVVNLDAPASSRLLTKGVHDGPALLASEASALLEWVKAEKDAQPVPEGTDPKVEIEPFIPAICTSGTPPAPTCPVNDVDLTVLGLTGAKLHFVAQALGSGLYLNQLSIIGGPDGVYLEHPLFVSYPAMAEEPTFDTIDRFFNVKINSMANETTMIGGGTAAFIGFTATDKMSIHFKVLKAYQPETGMGEGGGDNGGGCKALASFKTNAQNLFANAVPGAGQSCLSCHGGQNGNATSAMNITGVNSQTDATIQTACNQIRTRINTTTIDQSGIYLAPDPANNNHPFKLTAAQLTTFKNGVNVWINAEKVAP
jgi:mono/diheme cytochrome c family protein